MTTTTDTPRRDAYYAGKGCKCAAHNWSECGCDVDWTDPRIYELEAEVEKLKTDLRRSIKIADVLMSGGSRACRELHHSKRDQHEYGEVCPVEERLEKAESELDQLKATLNRTTEESSAHQL